mmetsp:Transcript_47532/g.118872  ORF Transcript_47532/g.118872 Transcript_47532/m.118872 type:complete len:247 (-) Transcript_47532:759-1499(-)
MAPTSTVPDPTTSPLLSSLTCATSWISTVALLLSLSTASCTLCLLPLTSGSVESFLRLSDNLSLKLTSEALSVTALLSVAGSVWDAGCRKKSASTLSSLYFLSKRVCTSGRSLRTLASTTTASFASLSACVSTTPDPPTRLMHASHVAKSQVSLLSEMYAKTSGRREGSVEKEDSLAMASQKSDELMSPSQSASIIWNAARTLMPLPASTLASSPAASSCHCAERVPLPGSAPTPSDIIPLSTETK